MSAVSSQGHELKALTHARILAIALPIMLSNASVPLVGLSDTFVMGRLGGQGLIGGVGFAVTVLTMVFWFFNFFRHSTTAYMAQALGRGDQDEQSLIVWRNGLAASRYRYSAARSSMADRRGWILVDALANGAGEPNRPRLL